MQFNYTSSASFAAFAGFMVVLCVGAFATAQDKADEIFQSIYGPQYQQAMSSASSEDNQALAEQLIEAAGQADQAPELIELFCDKAYALTQRDAGSLPLAIEAMRLLAERVPARQMHAEQQILQLLLRQVRTTRGAERTEVANQLIDQLMAQAQAQIASQQFDQAERLYRRALGAASSMAPDRREQVRQALDAVRRRQQIQSRIKKYQSRLKADNSNTAVAEALIDIYLLELDQPEEANKYSFLLSDPTQRQMVALAARQPDALSPEQSVQLGEWYYQKAQQAPSDTAGLPLRRASMYLQQYLDSSPSDVLSRQKAALLLQQVQAALEKASTPATAGGSSFVDLLRAVDLEKVPPKGGQWQMRGGQLTAVPDGDDDWEEVDRLAIPVSLDGNYELKFSFERVEGDGKLTLSVPVAKTWIAVVFEDTKKPMRLPSKGEGALSEVLEMVNGRTYTCRIRVEQTGQSAQIQVDMGQKTVMRWNGPIESINIWHFWKPYMAQAVGLSIYESQFKIKELKGRMMTGRMRSLK